MLKKLALCSLLAFLVTASPALQVGDAAPDFKLQDETGAWRTLSEFNGKKLLLFFYPKDRSPICSSQIRGLRDNYKKFEQNNIAVLGINYDSVESHKNLKDEYEIPYNLLSDANGEVAAAYGAKRTVNLFPKRNSYLIENGKIKHIMLAVEVKTHVEDVLKAFGVQ